MAFWSAQSSIARDRIKELLAGGAKPGDILVLSRFNFGYSRLQDACERDAVATPVALVKEGKVVKAGIRFLSIHGSKGLEAPHVIILNAYEGKYGLPAASRGWLDPKILNPDLSDPEDEERRLFFVGITRARDTLTVITWQGQESRFLDAVPSAADFFQGAATLWLEGTIARESEKSYLVRLEYGFNEGIETWIPKSQIEAWQPPGTGRSVKFKVSDWWWRKKLADLDLRDEIRKKSR